MARSEAEVQAYVEAYRANLAGGGNTETAKTAGETARSAVTDSSKKTNSGNGFTFNTSTGEKKNKNTSGTSEESSAYKAPEDEAAEHAKEMSGNTYGDADNGGTMMDKVLTWLGIKNPSQVPMSKEASETSTLLQAEKNKLALLEAQQNDAGGTSGNSFEEIDGQRAAVDAQRQVVANLEHQFEEQHRNDQSDYYSSLFNNEDFEAVAKKGSQITDGNRVRYIDENPYDPTAMNPLAVTNDKNLAYINDDERAAYNYLLGKGDKQGADEFLAYIMPTLNARAGQETATNIENSGNGFMRTLREVDLGGAAGVQNAVGGIMQNFTSDVQPTHELQYALQGVHGNIAERHQNNQDFNLEKIAVDAAQTIGNMTPAMLAGGGVGDVFIGLSTRGNTYKQLRDEGYSEDEARSVGTILGIAEAGTQYLLSGVSRLGGTITKGVVEKATQNMTSAAARTAVELGIDLLGENVEEWMQNKIEPGVRNLMLGENNQIEAFDKDDLYTVLLTTLTTGLLEAPSAILNNASSAGVGKSVKLNEATESLIQRGMQSANPEVRELAEGMQSGKTAQSDINLGNLAKGLNAEGVDLANIAAQSAAQQIAPETVSPEARTEVLNIMQSGRVNNTDAKTILADPALRAAFTAISGNPLNGTSFENQKAIQDYARSSAYATQQSQQAAQQFADMQTAQNEAEAQAAAQANAEAEQARIDADAEAQAREATKQQDNIDFVANIAKGGATVAEAHAIVDSPALRALWEMMTGTTLPESRSKATDAVRAGAEIVNNVTGADVLANMATQQTAPETAQPTAPQTGADILAEMAGVPQNAPESVSNAPSIPTNENAQAIPQNNAQTALVELNNQAQQTAPTEPIDRPLFNTPMGMNGTSEVREGNFSSNTLNNVQEANNIPEADRMSFTYETKPERQSVMEAAVRLGNDRANEVQKLMDAEAWSGVQTDMAAQVERELYESGDVKAHADWVKVMNDHAISGGQGVQAWAKYSRKTGQNALEEVINAVNANENLTEEQRTQILNKADEAAHKYDNVQNDILNAQKAAKENGTKAEAPQSLIDFIKETSEARNTGTIFSKNLDKLLNAQKGNLDYLNSLAYNQMIAMSNDYTVSRTLAEKVKSLQILAQLTSIATFNRNIGGNVSFGAVDALLAQDGVGVAVDYLVSKFTGKRTVNFDKSWLSSASRKGAIDGFQKSALEVALDVDMGGTNKYGQSSGRTFKMSGNGVERFFSRWEQLLNYSLTTSDRTSRGQMEAETTRSLNALKNSGLTDADIQAIAEQNADYRLFQNKGMAYTASKGLHDVLNAFGFGGTFKERARGQGGFGLGDIVNTYPGVPANLGVKALEYSPANIVKGGVELAQVIKSAKSGKLDAAKQNQAVMDVARGFAGMPMVALFAAAFRAGILKNWDDEDDYDVMAQNSAEGKSGTQINWDAMERWLNGGDATWKNGDTLDSVGWLEPINAFMSIGSLIANEGDDATLSSMAGDWAEGAIQGVLEIPVMGNISTAVDSFRYSTADNLGGKAADAAISYLGNSATGFVPSPVRGIASSLDDYQRDTKGNTAGETALNSFMATIPGLRETLPIKRDGYGNVRTNDGDVVDRLFNTLVNPSNRTHLKQSGISEEVEQLSLSTGNKNIYPERQAPRTINYGNGNKVQLDADDRREYFGIESNKTEELYSSIMSDPNWSKFSDEQKASLLSNAKSVANAMAKAEYARRHNIEYEDPYEVLINGTDKPGTANDIPALGEENLVPYLQYHSMYNIAEKSGDADQFDSMIESFDSLPKPVQDVFLKKQDGAGSRITAYGYGIHTADYNAYGDAKEQAQGVFDKNTGNNGVCELYALGDANISDEAKEAIFENREDLGWLSKATATSYDILNKYGFDFRDVANFFYSADFTVTEDHPEGKSGGTLGPYETAYALSQMNNLDDDDRAAIFEEFRDAFDNTYNKWSPKSYTIALSRVGRYEQQYGSIYGRRENTDSRLSQVNGNSSSSAKYDGASAIYESAYGNTTKNSLDSISLLMGGKK